MNCAQFKKIIYVYLDNELKGAAKQEFEAHLKACPVCAKQLEISKKAWALLDKYQEIEPAPNFNAQVFERIAEGQIEPEPRRRFEFLPQFTPRLAPALAAIAIVLFILVALKILPFSRKTEEVIVERVPEKIEQIQPAQKIVAKTTQPVPEPALTDEELFIVENMEMLSQLDVLEEDLELLEDLDLADSLQDSQQI